MEKTPKNLKTPAIVAAAALAVILLLVGIFVNSVQKGKRETIELPESSASSQQAAGSAASSSRQEGFAEVTPDNVQSILKSVSRPDAYHQTFSILTTDGAAEKTVTAELWVSGKKMRAEITDGSDVKTILTDGKTLCIWYNDDQKPVTLALGADVTQDDLAGIPTYEQLLELPRSAIRDASFVTLEEDGNQECVFVDSASGSQRQYDWISLGSGLLYKHTTLADGVQVYAAQQTSLETLMDGDESLSGVFLLPDKTDPFAK